MRQKRATNVPTIEIVSGLDLCGKYRTRLQASNYSSVYHLLHVGLSTPEEKTETQSRKRDVGVAYLPSHHVDGLSLYGKYAESRGSTPINSAIPGMTAVALGHRQGSI